MNSQELNLIFDPVNQRLTFVNEGMREGETYLVTKRNGQLVCEEGNIPTPWSPAPDPDTGLVPCGWCGPERMGWFSVQFWVRASTGKRKWMSVTQKYKKQVNYCPMCGRKLEAKG